MPAGVTNEPYLVASDILSRVFISAQKKYVKNKLAKANWASLPLLGLLESIKENEGISGDDGAINDGMQLVPELTMQFIRGEDTIMNPQIVNDSIRFESIYTHTVMPIKFIHDEWRQRGWEIVPHQPGDFMSRVKQMGEERLQRLSNDLMRYTMDGVNQAFSEKLEQAYFKQGASYKEPVGVNGQFPIVPIGSLYGHNRANTPIMRHLTVGGTIGASGTLVPNIRTMYRQLNENIVNSGIDGEWVCLAGGGFMDGYHSEVERLGISRNADIGGVKKADVIILDEALRIGSIKPTWWPLLDKADTLFSGERGITASPNAVTFSGGGSPTRQATGFAMVSAGGAVTAIVVTDPGEGYTSAPTVSVAIGTGATFQASVFSASSGTGLTQVAADDYRIGRLSGVAVTAGGSGYTAGSVISFTNRAFWFFKPAMRYKIGNGVDRRIVVPADPARTRSSELQMETLSYFYNRLPNAFAVAYRTN